MKITTGVYILLVVVIVGCENKGSTSLPADSRPVSDTHFPLIDAGADGRDSALPQEDTLHSSDIRPVLDQWVGEAALPPAPGLPGLYHLYPVGLVNGPADVFSYESCQYGYEYTAIVRLHDQQPCTAAIHVNATAWVTADPQPDTVHALMAKGPLLGAELKASWFRSWTPAGWGPYGNTASHAAATRFTDGSGAFSLYYEVATPPSEYPYEYGRLFPAGSGEAVSGLWRESTVSTYYLAAMASTGGEATFMRLVAFDGKSYFDIGYGSRNGDHLYAHAVWMLNHEGLWQQTKIENQPLQYRFNINTGELREWWNGSETAPDATSSFLRELDDSCALSHDFGTCNCADPNAVCTSPLCQTCGPWLPPR